MKVSVIKLIYMGYITVKNPEANVVQLADKIKQSTDMFDKINRTFRDILNCDDITVAIDTVDNNEYVKIQLINTDEDIAAELLQYIITLIGNFQDIIPGNAREQIIKYLQGNIIAYDKITKTSSIYFKRQK